MKPSAAERPPGDRDLDVIAGQLGRTPRDVTGIACRCPFGFPAVIETGPVLGGEPNPTLLYLTCPAMVKVVSRAESSGGVARFKEACREDHALQGRLAGITRLYRERRAALAGAVSGAPGGAPEGAPPGASPVPTRPGGEPAASGPAVRPEAGIGGPEGPEVASCLHAYAAAMLAVLSGWLRDDPAAACLASAAVADPGRGAAPKPGAAPLGADLPATWERFLPPLAECWCNDRLCARWDVGYRPAAIDVGTISVRLLVAEMVDGQPRATVRRAEITRLGEGLRPGGCLDVAAKKRTAAVVARFAGEARANGAGAIILAATSAARDAADGAEFVARLGRENDLAAAVLSGSREAELAYAGASLDVPGQPVVLDIGGGSTEIMRRHDRASVSSVSLDIGASRATERWLKSDPPTADQLAAARQEAVAAFARVRPMFAGAAAGEPGGAVVRSLVGVAGTVTTLACLDAGLQTYDADYLHLRTLTLDSVRDLVRRLSAMTTAERAALPCVQAGRAPVLVGGAVILQAAMETLGYDKLTVSERDLLDGLVMHGL